MTAPSAKGLPLLALLALAGCAERATVISFYPYQCAQEYTGQSREVRKQTTCLMYANGSMNPMNMGKPCIAWNHRDATEYQTVTHCESEAWTERQP